MGITPRFSPNDVRRMIEVQKQRIEDAIIQRLIYTGEAFVINARNNGNYLDHTGNLRSSIGYIVLKNGKTMKEDFKLSSKGTDRQKGLSEAKRLIEELKDKFNTGYVLIGIAGMQYAASVESKGKDVITASAITAKNDLKKAIAQIKTKIKNK